MSSFGPVSYNIDINQLGATQFPRFAVSQPTPYQDALVEDVILGKEHPQYAPDGSNIGMIQIRFIPGDRNLPKPELNWASPLDSSIREYPLKNELVLVFYSLGRLFYTKRINTTNKITESSWPGLSDRFSPKSKPENRNTSLRVAAEGGPTHRPWESAEKFSLGNAFSENTASRMVQPGEGDSIIYGRFGNTIRMGSSLFSNPITTNPQPNLLITVGHATPTEISTQVASAYSLIYEDINSDKNSIWITTDETIPFLAATIRTQSTKKAHLRSVDSPTTKYTGTQIIVNSDRLILNSKKNEISLFSNTQINFSSLQGLTFDTEKSAYFTANNTISISGEKIFIGSEGATEPMVLGNQLAQFLDELIGIFSNSTAAVIGSAPGTPAPFSPTLLSQLRSLKSKLSTPQFNSQDNFVSKQNNIKVRNSGQENLIRAQIEEARQAQRPFTYRQSLINKGQPTVSNSVLGRFNT
jgi:hypothetical protein